ncbi:MAG: hypothetical protein FJ109_02735 [Deltaproteobacteria bacterium]|nr:hypothetical protein [Deltaproteobacteria bacterium]
MVRRMNERLGRLYSRRGFLGRMAGLAGGSLLWASGCGGGGSGRVDAGSDGGPDGWGELPPEVMRRNGPAGPLLFICIDSLHPSILDLDAAGNAGGSPGNWLMPRLRKYMEGTAWYRNASCFLPSATDMNHLNIVAGTHSGLTGIISVFGQLTGWDPAGKPLLPTIHHSMARDDLGRPVDTLFHAYKRRFPDRKVAFIAGKDWVAEMFRTDPPVLDFVITGKSVPDYRPAPKVPNLYDPKSDGDATCDPESLWQTSLVTPQLAKVPDMFPSDEWIVDSTLELFAREKPDFAYILLAECDDAGHALGSAHDPSEFVKADPAISIEQGCPDPGGYQWVSTRNPNLYREPMLDYLREVDLQFGRLMDGLKAQGILDKATVIVFSDHSMENQLAGKNWIPGYSKDTDYLDLLRQGGFAGDGDVGGVSASTICNVYWREGKDRVAGAVALLEAYQAKNPMTGQMECPWWVVDRKRMKEGYPGVCGPGELYHPHFIDQDGEKTLAWPDLILFTRNGWQCPTYLDFLPKTPIPLPLTTGSIAPFLGGHGSLGTAAMVLGISSPSLVPGIVDKPVRIADVAMTVAAIFGLELESTTVGVDLAA